MTWRPWEEGKGRRRKRKRMRMITRRRGERKRRRRKMKRRRRKRMRRRRRPSFTFLIDSYVLAGSSLHAAYSGDQKFKSFDVDVRYRALRYRLFAII